MSSFLPRLRQACRPTRDAAASGGLRLPGPSEEANLAILTGIIVEEPVRDRGRDGEPITVLLLSFAAPDQKSRRVAACCEVEVPDEVADGERRLLRPGGRIVVLGRLTGAGGLWATAIVTRGTTPQGT